MVKHRSSNLTSVSQWGALRRSYPEGRGRVRRNQLDWQMPVQPTPLSDVYEIRLSYSLETGPKIMVKSPELIQPGDKPIPHRFSDGSLCLFLPGCGEWDRTMSLADTVIPWTSEWLFFYELWIATGEWCGGGHGTPAANESSIYKVDNTCY